MIRTLTRFRTALAALIFVASGACFAQSPVILGIGLSGSRTALDSIVVNGDSVFVISQYFSGPNWSVENVGYRADSLGLVRLYFYEFTVPADVPVSSAVYPVSRLQVDTLNDRLTFAVVLTGLINPYIRSLQIEMALLGRSTTGQEVFSPRRTSHAAVGGVNPILQPVDALHKTYLTYRDAFTVPPDLNAPTSNTSVPRNFVVRYTLYENAYPRTLNLTFQNVTSGAIEAPHVLRIRDLSAGTNIPLEIDASALLDTSQFDSLSGSSALTDGAWYRITLSYQDIYRNATASAALDSILVDRQTRTPYLFEPRLGSFTGDSTVRVIYQLMETPDSVWLTFSEDSTFDTTGVVHDPLSPHILRLSSELHGSGVISFFLDGRDIGSNNPLVESSNRGPFDALVSQCIYNVTLSYGDQVGNQNASVTNRGYVWPDDRVTIPPRILEPSAPTAFGEQLRLVCNFPETPLPGSVYVRFFGLGPQDPGNPHRVYLGIHSAGISSFYLNCSAFTSSGIVDSVLGSGTPEQNNQLVDGMEYQVQAFYQDSLANPSRISVAVRLRYDRHTEPVTIYTPQPGDTLDRASVLVRFALPENAADGRLRMIFERTRGDEDPSSPHILFLSDDLAGTAREIIVRPGALSGTNGVDSVQGGNSLMDRAVYRLKIEYRDSLLNDWAVTSIEDLVFPSGTIVYASGGSAGPGIVFPTMVNVPVFRLNLMTENGQSIFQAVRLRITGDLTASDININHVKLWASVDTVFDNQDTEVDRLQSWPTGDLVFDDFAAPISDFPTNFIVTFSYLATANSAHRFNLTIRNPASINCGTDPVYATQWPIGTEDVPLNVLLTEFTTEQDTAFGSLRLRWITASEQDNAGFVLFRKRDGDPSFLQVARYTSSAELVGHGTTATSSEYIYVDKGLEPGIRYVYRLAVESINLAYRELDMEAEGIPQLPPADFILGNPYPNPFNQQVSIPYVVPYPANVEIVVYDILGREIRTVLKALRPASVHRAVWDGCDMRGIPVPSGIYLFRMIAGETFVEDGKLLLIR